MWLAVALAAFATLPKDWFGDLLPPGVIARYGTNRLCYGRFIDVNTTSRMRIVNDFAIVHSTPTEKHPEGPGPVIGWDLTSGKELPRAISKAADLKSEPAGRYRVEPLPDGHARVWDTTANKAVAEFDLGIPKPEPAFGQDDRWQCAAVTGSPDGAFAAWHGAHGGVHVREHKTGRIVTVPIRHAISQFRFTASGKLAVLVNDTIALFDPKTGRPTTSNAPTLAVSASAVSPDGKRVVGTSHDGAVWVWDADTAKVLWRADSGWTVFASARFDLTGRFVIAVGWNQTVAVFDAGTGKPVGRDLPSPSWSGKTGLEGGKLLLDVVADETRFGSPFVRVRELATRKEVRRVELEQSGGWQSSMQATVSANGKVIVLRRPSFGDLAVYDAATGKLQRTLHLESGPYIGHVFDMTPDGRLVATRTTPGTLLDVPEELIVFDTTTDRVLVRRPCRSRDEMFHAVAVSPDGRYTAGCIGKNGTTVVLDLRNGAKVRELSGEVAAFFPDGRSVLTIPHIRGMERVNLEPAAWRNRPPTKPSDIQLSQLWKELGEPGEAGFDAVLEVGRFPDVARPFLKAKLAEGVPDAKRVAEWIESLSAKDFAEREASSNALREAGPGVVPALRAALRLATHPETRKRLEKAIQALGDTTRPDTLRRLRAEDVLERSTGPK